MDGERGEGRPGYRAESEHSLWRAPRQPAAGRPECMQAVAQGLNTTPRKTKTSYKIVL